MSRKPSPDTYMRQHRHVGLSRYFRGENHDARWNVYELNVRMPRVPRPDDAIIEGDRADIWLHRKLDRESYTRGKTIERTAKVRKLNKRRTQRRFKAQMREQDVALD